MTTKQNEDKNRWVDPKFDYLIRMFGRRTGRKDAENFVVNMIWTKLLERGCEIQPITQQIVFGTSGKHYYLDLYFPAVKLAIECDEGQHKDLAIADNDRVEDILDALIKSEDENKNRDRRQITPWKKLAVQRAKETLDAKFMRVKTYETNYEGIVRQIDHIVDEIISRKDIAEQEDPGSTAWKKPQAEIDELKRKTQAELVAGHSPEFQTIAEAYNLFRRDPVGAMQRGWFSLPNQKYTLWFPQSPKKGEDGRLEPRNNDGWINLIQEDFSILETNVKNPAETACPPQDNKELLPRLTFFKDRNALEKTVYRFAGVYQFLEVTEKGRLYRRIADGIRWYRGQNDEFPMKIELINLNN